MSGPSPRPFCSAAPESTGTQCLRTSWKTGPPAGNFPQFAGVLQYQDSHAPEEDVMKHHLGWLAGLFALALAGLACNMPFFGSGTPAAEATLSQLYTAA